MNAKTTYESAALELAPAAEQNHLPQMQSQSLPINSPAGMMMAAMAQGASLEQIEKMMDLQDRWEQKEAEKAYNAAFAAFKAEAVHIMKGRTVTDGPLKGKSYAELHDVVDAVTPALSSHGLSASWKLTRDDKDWMEVTCTLKHVSGHSESVSMGGAPDTGGAKNALQARASTKTYLERYTLKAICGVAEGGDDTDGNPPPDRSADSEADGYIAAALTTKTDADALQYWKDHNSKFAKNLAAHAKFKEAVAQHRLDLAHAAKQGASNADHHG
ncbi:ERF family protein [Comamonas sp. NoAH]|uniref:ERF family protein n=1 Tax=Comamonas halotolerans TaxID=3041496 RepID=UPI0024E13322|nr:ERF family protein [Comamonas sp. NoAH]